MKHLFISSSLQILRSLFALLVCLILCFNSVYAADPPEGKTVNEGQVDGEPLAPTAADLWEKANKHLQDGDQEKAAQYFYTVFNRFPDDVNTATSL